MQALCGQYGKHHLLQPAGAQGLNIEFEHSFGGKLRWLIRLQTGIWMLPPHNRFLTTPPTARTPVTGNADWSLGNRCLLWFPVYTPIQRSWGLWPFTEGWEAVGCFFFLPLLRFFFIFKFLIFKKKFLFFIFLFFVSQSFFFLSSPNLFNFSFFFFFLMKKGN